MAKIAYSNFIDKEIKLELKRERAVDYDQI